MDLKTFLDTLDDIEENAEQIEMSDQEKKLLENVTEDSFVYSKKKDKAFWEKRVLESIVSTRSYDFINESLKYLKKFPKNPDFLKYIHQCTVYPGRCLDILKVLEESGFDIPPQKASWMISYFYADEPLEKAEELIRYLQTKGGDIDYSGPKNKDKTILMLASMYGDHKLTKLLLELGASPSKQLENGDTALLYVAGKPPERGTEIHLRDLRLITARYLLEAGADPLYAPTKNNSAVFYAKKGKYAAMVELLESFI